MRIVTQTRDGWLLDVSEADVQQLIDAMRIASVAGAQVWQSRISQKLDVLENRHKRIPGRQP